MWCMYFILICMYVCMYCMCILSFCVYVCMYVCMYVCIYCVCTLRFEDPYVRDLNHVCMYVLIRMFLCICMHVCSIKLLSIYVQYIFCQLILLIIFNFHLVGGDGGRDRRVPPSLRDHGQQLRSHEGGKRLHGRRRIT